MEPGSERYFVERPAYEVVPAFEVLGRIPAMTIMIGAGSLAEADPGGHQERLEQGGQS